MFDTLWQKRNFHSKWKNLYLHDLFCIPLSDVPPLLLTLICSVAVLCLCLCLHLSSVSRLCLICLSFLSFGAILHSRPDLCTPLSLSHTHSLSLSLSPGRNLKRWTGRANTSWSLWSVSSGTSNASWSCWGRAAVLQPRAAWQRGRGYAWTVWALPSVLTAPTPTKVGRGC